MNTGSVAVPFGPRPISLAAVRRQLAAADIKVGKSVNKWRLKKDASAAMNQLGLQSNSLAVLDALLSFYPEDELRQDTQLVVYPSNLQLSLRANGMPGSTMRRHLAALVEAGLILRRDSANGKRYVRKSRTGEIETAFGFDLSPLLARAEELAHLAQQVVAERAAFRKAKEDLTVCRRDVRKLISAALDEGARGDWLAIEDVYIKLVARLPRTPSIADVTDILDEMELLKQEIVNRLESLSETEFTSTNAVQIEQHIQNSKSESPHEFEPRSEKEQEARPSATGRRISEPLKTFPLGIVQKACPQIGDFGPGGGVTSWRDLMSAAVVVRSMLGISPSAYQDACETMGPENAAVAVACILERANLINSAGGYMRDLTRRADRGEFSLGPMVMALYRTNSHNVERAG